jgi:hypothetical protein
VFSTGISSSRAGGWSPLGGGEDVETAKTRRLERFRPRVSDTDRGGTLAIQPDPGVLAAKGNAQRACPPNTGEQSSLGFMEQRAFSTASIRRLPCRSPCSHPPGQGFHHHLLHTNSQPNPPHDLPSTHTHAHTRAHTVPVINQTLSQSSEMIPPISIPFQVV